jgi:hypothetical protein
VAQQSDREHTPSLNASVRPVSHLLATIRRDFGARRTGPLARKTRKTRREFPQRQFRGRPDFESASRPDTG